MNQPAQAATTFYVSTVGTATSGCTVPGTGACKTIREGITAAEFAGGTVDVAAGTYSNDTDDSVDAVNGPVDVEGAGASSTTVEGISDNTTAFLTIEAGTVTVDGLTFSGNTDTVFGGAVYIVGGTVTADHDTFSGNSATGGGGGAMLNAGNLTADDDTFSGNSVGVGSGGGAIFNEGTFTANDDTFSGNSATAGVGVIYNTDTLTADDDTFSGNSGKAGDGFLNIGSITMSNSIVDQSKSCDNLGTITDGGYNVESDDSCGLSASDTPPSEVNVPMTGTPGINLATSLAANGSTGPATLAIGPGSAAYEEVPAAQCTITTDERGDARPGDTAGGNTNCDAGAYEYQNPIVPLTVNVSGTETYPGSPTFTETDTAPPGVLSGTPTCTDAMGVILTSLTPGSYTLDGTTCSGMSATAGYSIDYVGVTDGFVVSPNPTTLTLAVAPNPAVYGTSVTFTATLSGGLASPDEPKGSITLALWPVAGCASGTPLTLDVNVEGNGVYTLTTTSPKDPPVGTSYGQVYFGDSDGDNTSSSSGECDQILSVTPAHLVVHAPALSTTYGTIPTLTPTYSGLVNGDTAPNTPAACTTTATTHSSPGTYAVTCSGAVDPNYSITYVAGTLKIVPAPTSFKVTDFLTTTKSGTTAVLGETGLPAGALGFVFFQGPSNGCTIYLTGQPGEATTCMANFGTNVPYTISGIFYDTDGDYLTSDSTNTLTPH